MTTIIENNATLVNQCVEELQEAAEEITMEPYTEEEKLMEELYRLLFSGDSFWNQNPETKKDMISTIIEIPLKEAMVILEGRNIYRVCELFHITGTLETPYAFAENPLIHPTETGYLKERIELFVLLLQDLFTRGSDELLLSFTYIPLPVFTEKFRDNTLITHLIMSKSLTVLKELVRRGYSLKKHVEEPIAILGDMEIFHLFLPLFDRRIVYFACSHARLEMLSVLHSEGYNFTDSCTFGRFDERSGRPIEANFHSVNVWRKLLECGVDLKARDEIGLFLTAYHRGSTEVMLFILFHTGLDLNTERVFDSVFNPCGWDFHKALRLVERGLDMSFRTSKGTPVESAYELYKRTPVRFSSYTNIACYRGEVCVLSNEAKKYSNRK